MAKKQSISKALESVEKIKVASDKSVEDIEEDLQLPSSSDDDDASDVEEEEEHVLSEESDDEDVDDEINGLSSDEEEEEEEESKESKSGHSVNKVIKASEEEGEGAGSKKSKKTKKSGVIYIGRLPEGFQEKELKTYFKQFGDIVNLKLSRNKTTGKSKHYGFIEFTSPEVAQIAAETMNNYLLFGHLIKCEVVSEPFKDLFKDSKRKFKVIPWKKIAKDKHDKPKSAKEWAKLVEKFEESKKKKQEELKSKGIDFDLAAI
ncbi:hypothetical protein Cantr_01217 [Candida viswanathii]|uniref:RRM domain-containing protein n=1 Tax=Candida viswanathii TaxID=5486 RepID=A0A367YI68_9ASCO|nr:hypothetical protein Cantr_01217 [Candida viswanathii]